jgi:hypothetical protein
MGLLFYSLFVQRGKWRDRVALTHCVDSKSDGREGEFMARTANFGAPHSSPHPGVNGKYVADSTVLMVTSVTRVEIAPKI